MLFLLSTRRFGSIHERIVVAVELTSVEPLSQGFIAENVFLEKLERDPQSISIFLLLSILTVSARFSPVRPDLFAGSGEGEALDPDRVLSLQ